MRIFPPRSYRTRCVILLVALGVVPCVSADPATIRLESIKQAVRELVRSQMQEHKVPGLSLVLVDTRRVLWAEGFGYADRERKIHASPDTVYVAGNLTQALTAALAMQMAERGEIELDGALRRQLAEFSIRSRFSRSRPITPRNLLSHHSGLPAMHFRNMWSPNPEPLASFVSRLRHEYVAAPPGLVRVPSFPGYDVLGRLIEVKCGTSFARCMEKRLLTPLAMSRTTFDHKPDDHDRRARHYWSKKPVAFTDVRDLPAAGALSTVLDLGRFARMILDHGRFAGHALLKPSSVAEMLRAQNHQVPLDLDHRAGLPWHLTGVHFAGARTVAWLDNESPFARGRILLVPDQQLAVVLLTNSSGSSDAVRKISERLVQLVIEGRAPVVPAERDAENRFAAGFVVPRSEKVVGTYATQLGRIAVEARPDGYRARLMGKTLDLAPQPDGMLAPQYRLLGLIPIPLDVLKETRLSTASVSGHQLAIARYRGRTYRLGERVAPVQLGPEWRQRLGEYQVQERDELLKLVDLRNISLRYENGILSFYYRVPGWLGLVADVPVKPVSDSELIVEGTGWLMGDTIVFENRNGSEIVRYSGYEFRRIVPKK